MFNDMRVTRLENQVKLLIADTLEQFGKIYTLETEVIVLKTQLKALKGKKK